MRVTISTRVAYQLGGHGAPSGVSARDPYRSVCRRPLVQSSARLTMYGPVRTRVSMREVSVVCTRACVHAFTLDDLF